jgi:hypothetical protein
MLVAAGHTTNTAGVGLDRPVFRSASADISRSTTGSRRARLRSGQLAVRLRDAIIAHSTMAEGLVALLSKVPPVRAVARLLPRRKCLRATRARRERQATPRRCLRQARNGSFATIQARETRVACLRSPDRLILPPLPATSACRAAAPVPPMTIPFLTSTS